MKHKSIKVIFDTNVWISFLIGKRLGIIKEYISNENIKIITTSQLINEIKIVTSRPKLKKYFPVESVNKLIELLETISNKVEISPKNFINRDPKDNFLLDLIEFSKADYLVTGDKDLLIHNPFKSAEVISPVNFESVLKSLN